MSQMIYICDEVERVHFGPLACRKSVYSLKCDYLTQWHSQFHTVSLPELDLNFKS